MLHEEAEINARSINRPRSAFRRRFADAGAILPAHGTTGVDDSALAVFIRKPAMTKSLVTTVKSSRSPICFAPAPAWWYRHPDKYSYWREFCRAASRPMAIFCRLNIPSWPRCEGSLATSLRRLHAASRPTAPRPVPPAFANRGGSRDTPSRSVSSAMPTTPRSIPAQEFVDGVLQVSRFPLVAAVIIIVIYVNFRSPIALIFTA